MTNLGLQPMRGNVQGADVGRLLDMPRASVHYVPGFSIVNGVATVVSWDTRDYDTDGIWNGTTRLVCRTAGLYLFNALATWASNAAGYRQMYFQKNSVVAAIADSVVSPGTGTIVTQQIAAQLSLNAGDYIEVVVAQGSGGALNFNGTAITYGDNGFQCCLIST